MYTLPYYFSDTRYSPLTRLPLLIAFRIACLFTPKYSPAWVKVGKSITSLVWVFKSETDTPSRSVVLAFMLAKASGERGLFFL